MLRKLKNLEEREEGFTLIELLVVVIIIGILAAIAIPVFLNQREKAFRSAAKADLRNIATQLESYYTDNYNYTGYDLTDYQNSDAVNITDGVARTANSYCIEATHDALPGEYFSIASGPNVDSAAVVEAAC